MTCGVTGGGAGIGGTGVPPVGNLPVAAVAGGGNSNVIAGAPAPVPIDAVRRLTDCSTRSPSRREPTTNAFGILPSTAINATPVSPDVERGATTPSNLKRELVSGAGAAAVVAANPPPSRRERSPRTAVASPTGTAYAGAEGARTSNRNPQNTTLTATR